MDILGLGTIIMCSTNF